MTSKRSIYLDHHATTPCDPRVVEAMLPYFCAEFGNASSASHAYGWAAEEAVAIAREAIAGAIGAAEPSEIVFTSGTTESDNLALSGVVGAYRKARGSARDHIVTTAIEHPAVLDTCRALEVDGAALTIVPVDAEGLVRPEDVAQAITERTLLVSVMAANSEIGTIQPLAQIGRICRERDVFFHTDAAQAVGRIPVDVEAWGVDLLSMCAHKLYGPKGVGALYVRKRRPRLRLKPLLHGGGHEGGHRSGTLPVPLIVGFARALEIALDGLADEAERLSSLRDDLWKRLSVGLSGVSRNGPERLRLPGNLSVSFAGVDANQLLLALPDVALSTGSACASASGEPSHVLIALGQSAAKARSTLRIGIGRSNSAEEIARVADKLISAVEGLRGAGAGAAR